MRHTSRERLASILRDAEAIGHTMRLEHRPPPDDAPRGFHKYWVVCSCGYTSTARRAPAAAISTVAWHAGNVLGEAAAESDRVNGGVSLPRRARPAL